MGDFNIDLRNIATDGFLYLNNLCETHSLKNLIKNKTCFSGTTSSSIDAILTNKPR